MRTTKHVRLDEQVHDALGLMAKVRRTTLQDLANEILREWAKEHPVESELAKRNAAGAR